jgi:hypothetical protein
MPEVPPLEECELEEVVFKRRAARENLPPDVRDLFLAYAQVMSLEPHKSAIIKLSLRKESGDRLQSGEL